MRPERSFVNCMDAADLRIAAPGRLGPPRLRNALAVQARNPKRPRRAPPPILDETALGRPGRSGALYTACNGFNFALQTPIYTRCAPAATPRLSHATPAGPPALVAQTPRFATKTPTRHRPRTRASCARRLALGQRGSDSAPPPSLSRAPILTHSSISKSSPRDLDLQYPGLVLNIGRAKCQVGAPSQWSMTKRSFRHGFEFCTGWRRPSCSTWKYKQSDFFSTALASGRRRGR